MLSSKEIRQKFFDFFVERGHAIIPSASLVPENDPTVLFTTAGMQPLVPYLLGEPHPEGKRLVNSQKSLRTVDIEEVGDDSHGTFFEMLGFWSLGDYGKKDAIAWVWEFFTSLDWLGIPKNKLAVSVFKGDDDAPKDEEAISIWKDLGVPTDRIFEFGKLDNWWGPAGLTGPTGPDTEVFFDTGKGAHGKDCRPGEDCGKWMEIGNIVFMEYFKDEAGTYGPAPQKNIDTGLGLERLTMALQDKSSVYETDLFEGLMEAIEINSKEPNTRSNRIIADHIKASTFIVADGIIPSNVDQGYILRRLIRRALRHANQIGLPEVQLAAMLPRQIIGEMGDIYPELRTEKNKIIEVIPKEIAKFKETLRRGERELERKLSKLEKGAPLKGKDAFYLYETYGFPLELTVEFAKERGVEVDSDGFQTFFEKHQATSRKGAEKKFTGGLADHSATSIRYHTATHLLHQSLKNILGDDVEQRGSNITPERLRFDFSYPEKLTADQIKAIEDLVNNKIQEGLAVTFEELDVEEARKRRAIGVFEEKYGNRVKVYKMGDFSFEICGGPHVKNTKEVGSFKIVKESSVGQGIRRIKAVVDEVYSDQKDLPQ